MAKKTLSVFANPYSGISHDGIPSGVFPCDPSHAQGQLRYPAASIDVENSKLLDHEDAHGMSSIESLSTERSQPQTLRFLFEKEPETVPCTSHYLMGLRCEDLIPADEKTSKLAGFKNFTPPMDKLRSIRTNVIEQWEKDYGELPAFALDPKLDPWAELAIPAAPNPPTGDLQIVPVTLLHVEDELGGTHVPSAKIAIEGEESNDES